MTNRAGAKVARPPVERTVAGSSPAPGALATTIVGVLAQRSVGMSEQERIRYVYNEAVDDAANFLRDLVKHNPDCGLCLMRAYKSVRQLALPEG